MAPLEWSSSLQIGVEDIDNQHKEILGRINSLMLSMQAGKGAEQIGALLEFLTDYVKHHFAAEEKLMAELLYPGFEQHRGEHAEFVRDLATLKGEYEAEGASSHFAVKVNSRVGVWFVSHIMRSDRAIGTFLRRQRGPGATR